MVIHRPIFVSGYTWNVQYGVYFWIYLTCTVCCLFLDIPDMYSMVSISGYTWHVQYGVYFWIYLTCTVWCLFLDIPDMYSMVSISPHSPGPINNLFGVNSVKYSNHIEDNRVWTVERVRLFSISEVMWDTRVMSSFIGVVWDIIRDNSQGADWINHTSGPRKHNRIRVGWVAVIEYLNIE